MIVRDLHPACRHSMYRSCTGKWTSSALRWRRSAWHWQLQRASATAPEHPRSRPLSASLWVSAGITCCAAILTLMYALAALPPLAMGNIFLAVG